jgi:diguanylate cyclase (GGDEF)-like protein/PAS domain S-box-containing protein
MKQPIFRDKHFYIWLALFIACAIFYYFGELVNLFGWEGLRWEIFYTVHDPHRMLFLIPILYSSYYFRLRGALLANVMSLLIFLPRAFFISPYPDATLRMVAFVILTIVISMLTALTFNDRDKRHKLTDALKKAEEKNRIVLEQMYDTFYEVDLAGNFTFVNDAACLNLGYPREELIGNSFRIILSEKEAKAVFQAYHTAYISGEPNKGFAFEVRRKDGTVGFAESSITLLKNNRGEPVGFRSVGRDITERQKAEEALKESEERYRALFDRSLDLVYVRDLNGNFIDANPASLNLLGYRREDIPTLNFALLLDPDQFPRTIQILKELTETGFQKEPGEFKLKRRDGTYLYVETQESVIYRKGKPHSVQGVARDITERKQMQQKLEEMATHDFLTGLPNRVLLLDRFSIAAALAHRNKARLAVMSLDLDKFKTINDTLGHDAGDQVLKAVSTRLTGIIRASDTLARVGGDEFMLVMMETKRIEDTTAIAQKILDSFAEPLSIDGHELHLSTSIGIAIYPEDGQDLETLTKKSDAAMYYSKGHGRDQFKFFGDGNVGISGDHKSVA